jgi:predicted HTH domain antitoxin
MEAINTNEEFDILVEKGYYPSKSELIKDAFRALLNTNSELKISLSIELFLKGTISIGRASELAGLTIIEFKDILAGRGIVRETEGKTAKEMDKKLKRLGIV